MKGFTLAGVLFLTTAVPAFAAVNSCENVRNDIANKIMANGVPESGFSLTIVPNDAADSAAGQVVGHCANDTQKIVYQRLNDDGMSSDSHTPNP